MGSHTSIIYLSFSKKMLFLGELIIVQATCWVWLRDRSAQSIAHAATLRQNMQIKPCYLTQSQYTDTGPTSPSNDPEMPGTWQDCHYVWSTNSTVTGVTWPRTAKLNPWICNTWGGHLSTWPTSLKAIHIFNNIFKHQGAETAMLLQMENKQEVA